MTRPPVLAVLFVLSVLLFLSIPCFAYTTIDTVPVGDPGNPSDGRYAPYLGSVAYVYNMGKFEVTAGQYTEFLNKVAATDTYSLYNTQMSDTSQGSGITRSGASGSYNYSVTTDFINRPVNYVSFWDAVRFANWLHNGQPTGAQNLSTTEDGAYFINGYNDLKGLSIVRKPGARWFLPSENEWYKAAYYARRGSAYWSYPTKSNTMPGRDVTDVSGNNANCYGTPYPIDAGKYTTVVGEFQNSASPYGTFDQAGNVWEWNDTIKYQGAQYITRGIRGAAFNYPANYSSVVNSEIYSNPISEESNRGFRIANVVPEPSSLMILAGGISMFLCLRRRR